MLRVLPEASVDARDTKNRDRPSATLLLVQPHILVVEDDALVRGEIVSAVGPAWAVTEAADGEGAIKHLWEDSFAAIVLDLFLPHLSGYDVIRHLSMRRPELLARTIVLTGVADVSLAFIDPKSVFAILKKPLDAEELLSTLRQLQALPD